MRLRPVPPALSDSRNNDGPSAIWVGVVLRDGDGDVAQDVGGESGIAGGEGAQPGSGQAFRCGAFGGWRSLPGRFAQALPHEVVDSVGQALGELALAGGVVVGEEGFQPGAILRRRQGPPAGLEAARAVGVQGGHHSARRHEHCR